jgi:hypothetical protein
VKNTDEIKALVERAEEHFTWIRDILAAPHQVNIPAEYTDPKMRRIFLENFLDSLTTKIRVRIGEFTNSLRNSLNYLACAFAEQDSGSVGNQVQFPIESDPKVFASRRKTFLKGISDPHVALIERCQPTLFPVELHGPSP